MHLEKRGSRLYFIDAPYAVKNDIKSLGAHWDADARLWWIGATKAAVAQAMIDALPGKQKARDDKAAADAANSPLQTKVLGKATYKGKSYYYTWDGISKKTSRPCARLVSLDGTMGFFVDQICHGFTDGCQLTKHYSSARTIQSLRDYAEKARASDPNDPSTWTRDQKRAHLDTLDQMDEFGEAERLAKAWGIRDY